MKLFNKKSLLIGPVLLILVGVVVWLILKNEFSGQQFLQTLRAADYRWLVAGFLCMPVFVISEGLNIRRSLKLSGYHTGFFRSLKYAAAGFFFSSITPSTSGGQPAQLYYINKDGIKLSHGTFSLLSVLLSFEIAAIALGCIAVFFFSIGGNMPSEHGVLWFFFLGFLVNTLWSGFLVCLMFSKKTSHFFAGIAVWVYEKLLKKRCSRHAVLCSLAEYTTAAKNLRKNKLIFAKMLLTSTVQLCAFYMIPFFCCRTFNINDVSWFDAFCAQGILFVSVAPSPLPGASGFTEGGFALLFSKLISPALIGSVLITARFISFVFPLVACGIGLLFVAIFHRKKKKP